MDAFNEVCSFEDLSPIVRRYIQKDKRVFYLLNNGSPINFRDTAWFPLSNSASGATTRRCKKAWCRRARPLEVAGARDELGLGNPGEEIGRLIGYLPEPEPQQEREHAKDAQHDQRSAHQTLGEPASVWRVPRV